jgi:CheY-like chemotaxis protein
VLSVLVVDDEPAIRKLLQRVLESQGHEVRTAPDASTALSLIAEAQPTVVLCDVHMPGSNGLWLADRIRERYPTTAIVLATADQEVPPIESLRPGVVAYLVKPFRAERVIAAVADGARWSAQQAASRPPQLPPSTLQAPRDPEK